MNSIEDIITQAKEKIPEQGPLDVFVHHNTIHHYEHLDFFDAVKKAALDYNTRAFMPESFFLELYLQRKISKRALESSVANHLKTHNLSVPTNVLLNLLLHSSQEHVITKAQIDNLQTRHQVKKNGFHQSYFKEKSGVDIAYYPMPHILRFCAAYFDFGAAYWIMPHRSKGMWKTFCHMYHSSNILDSKFLKTLSHLVKSYQLQNPIQIINELLNQLMIPDEHKSEYIFSLTYRVKGWAGLIKSLEQKPEWNRRHDIIPSFIELTCIIIACEFASIRSLNLTVFPMPHSETVTMHDANFLTKFITYTLLYPEYNNELTEALPALTDLCREEIWQRAYENTFYHQTLSTYSQIASLNTPQHCYKYQIITCIDEREESFRRYLECDENCETFGFAGHFGINMQYQGYFDKRLRTLCPVMANPAFKIYEKPIAKKRFRLKTLLIWGEIQWLSVLSSKTLFRGIFQSFIGFFTQIIPITADIISPRITYKIKKKLGGAFFGSIKTKIAYKKEEQDDGIDLDTRVTLAKNILQITNLTRQFSPYVIIMGHGSSSLNNPHQAAYDCGACGGGRGDPNARVMCAILNEPEVREKLLTHNIKIPSTTVFVAAYHNTCNDEVIYYDLPDSINENLKQIQKKINQAAHLDAKERSRRFASIPIGKSPKYYAKQVGARSVDLRQPRPECGHATNALCVIGPRSATRHIFFDRRAFLVSYDEINDTDNQYLATLLNTAGPVCAGINLEYYFSYIANETYGCGTKLPHNVTSLVGVINGYQSDLQLGLPWQMVEIHHPLRLLMLIICKLSSVEAMLSQDTSFSTLVKNNWIALAVHNTEDNKLYFYNNGKFETGERNEILTAYFRIDKTIFNTMQSLDFGRIVQ